MGSKVFIYVIVPFETRKKHLDHWEDCSLPELYAAHLARITCIDSSIFLILPPDISFHSCPKPTRKNVGKLLCYDLRREHKSDTADSPATVKQSPCATALSPESTTSNFLCYDTVNKSFSYRSDPRDPRDMISWSKFPHVVAVNKDIYLLTASNMFCYSTTEDSWKKLTGPAAVHRPCHAFCMKGKLAVLGLGPQSLQAAKTHCYAGATALLVHFRPRHFRSNICPTLIAELVLEVYDNATDTWELSSLNPGLKFATTPDYNVFSSY